MYFWRNNRHCYCRYKLIIIKVCILHSWFNSKFKLLLSQHIWSNFSRTHCNQLFLHQIFEESLYIIHIYIWKVLINKNLIFCHLLAASIQKLALTLKWEEINFFQLKVLILRFSTILCAWITNKGSRIKVWNLFHFLTLHNRVSTEIFNWFFCVFHLEVNKSFNINLI